MPELNIFVAVLITLSIAYLFVYPRFSGNDVKKMAWLDILVGGLLLAVLAPFYSNSSNEFTFFFFDTNWWIFTILVYGLAEIPLFLLYIRARGLGQEYKAYLFSGMSLTNTASVRSVEKQLADTKWDGLRTTPALRFLVIGANTVLVVGAAALWQLKDNAWSSLTLLHAVLVGVFWFLLRTAVRLIPDAPREALDERLLRDRDSSYFSAYQVLAMLATGIATALLVFVIIEDLGDSDGFNYQLNMTWPQLQAFFWLNFGYATMLPSMVSAWREAARIKTGQGD